MQGLIVSGIKKSFNDVLALKGVTFQLDIGKSLAILGPSGCGKSTLLHIIAGIEQPDEGNILWDGESVLSVPPHKRGFGLMFQDYALFPHLNVYENFVYGLRTAGWDEGRIKQRYRELLELFKLQDFSRRDVFSLSGGEQQRVALGRSLAPQPCLLMLDEPLGALDRSLRESLLEEIPAILHGAAQTTIYVTHDQEEAFAIADSVAVMDHGRVIQIGDPKDIYYHPSTPFVARFLGFSNIFPGVVTSDTDGSIIETPLGKWRINRRLPDGKAEVVIRPDMMVWDAATKARLSGTVSQNTFRGGFQTVTLDVNGHSLTLSFPLNDDLSLGKIVEFGFDPSTALHIYPTI